MQKWKIFAKDFAKEWVEYPLLAMTATAITIANAQCERTLTLRLFIADPGMGAFIEEYHPRDSQMAAGSHNTEIHT